MLTLFQPEEINEAQPQTNKTKPTASLAKPQSIENCRQYPGERHQKTDYSFTSAFIL